MKFLFIGLGILFLIIIIVFATSYYIYRRIFYNGKRIKNDLTPLDGDQYDKYDMASLIEQATKIPFEDVWIKSKNGLSLYGRYYHTNDDAPLHIQFNGYKGNGIRDFAGGLQLALKLGANVLLVDQRAHGYSEGKTITFGIKERYDVIDWINYSIDRFGLNKDIFLDGVSMGAATVLMVGDQTLPTNIKGILADCPYSSPKDIIFKVTREMKINPKIIYPFMLIGARIFGHFNLNEASAVNSVKNFKVPVLIIHGSDDRFVPLEMSKMIRDENPEFVTLVEVNGAPHGLSYMQDYELYYNSVKEFIEKCK